jgi:hypothetical protein
MRKPTGVVREFDCLMSAYCLPIYAVHRLTHQGKHQECRISQFFVAPVNKPEVLCLKINHETSGVSPSSHTSSLSAVSLPNKRHTRICIGGLLQPSHPDPDIDIGYNLGSHAYIRATRQLRLVLGTVLS